ncbi:hypothetical protein FA13DRAFT_1668709 [Coprinellus micaceus]|uniref:BTB domain-containing protein n=1 Tax=Coprinellus micaceus TaxID=71717 RepID=A0A4Y7SUN3_COPMI|nr:hypothetical protein FA13DRAFT_1668709 [Coprinellus micaceus]
MYNHQWPFEQGQLSWPSVPQQDPDQTLYDTPPGSSAFDYATYSALQGLARPPTPTVPNSSTEQDKDAPQHRVVTVSTYFHPSRFPQSDLILLSSDGIRFYVQKSDIDAASTATVPAFLFFAGHGADDDVVQLPVGGQILTIILSAIYRVPRQLHSPTCDELIEAVDKMPEYALVPKELIAADNPLLHLLLAHAPLRPLDIYALAGHHGIEQLAKPTSSHLLSVSLHHITDALAARIGTTYLRRLFLLHKTRVDTLKQILSQTPRFHPQTKLCDFEAQKKLTRTWALGTTRLAWKLRADTSTQDIKDVFEPLITNLGCGDCMEKLKEQLQDVLETWAIVNCTI